MVLVVEGDQANQSDVVVVNIADEWGMGEKNRRLYRGFPECKKFHNVFYD